MFVEMIVRAPADDRYTYGSSGNLMGGFEDLESFQASAQARQMGFIQPLGTIGF